MDDEDRIALFLDYENLALGARDHLGGQAFDLKPITDALAERGRVVVRRAYADWSYFDEDRRMLTRSHVELIEMPQRMGASRKNAADIKMAVDAVELAFVRDYISTFVVCTGDSDFTPLVHKLRELNKRVIGFGVRDSTSALLPPACDEFLFYDTLEGVEPPTGSETKTGRGSGSTRKAGGGAKAAKQKDTARKASEPKAAATKAPEPEPEDEVENEKAPQRDVDDIAVLVAQTVAGLQRTGGEVTASTLKRTLLRKDPTFSEADHGFRAFGELLRHLAARNVVELVEGPAKGDPEVLLPELGDREEAFALLRSVVQDLGRGGEPVALSGLKDKLRRSRADFSEKKLGYRSFLQFCRAATTTGSVDLKWDEDDEDYLLTVPDER
ncbi:MAG: NYN domain-containing protein [Actinomycetota bacterium]|nr:NYN domain-containing protein [Actinomycetota bacterium]